MCTGGSAQACTSACACTHACPCSCPCPSLCLRLGLGLRHSLCPDSAAQELLAGVHEMQKGRHKDPYRYFDVLVFEDRRVLNFTGDWGQWVKGGVGVVRVTMIFNGAPLFSHRMWCWGVKSYTHRCALVQPLLRHFRSPAPPDVFAITALLWDRCQDETEYLALMRRLGHILHVLHRLSPSTRMIWRTPNAVGGSQHKRKYRTSLEYGAAHTEVLYQQSVRALWRYPWLRFVDVYDMVHPWTKDKFPSDGHHLSCDANSRFLHSAVLQLLLHEMCV